jgi:hypothetical protein
MSDLSMRALGVTILPKAAVEDVYATNSLTTKSLCLSHERLRSKLQGAEILLGERDQLLEELVGFATHAAYEHMIDPEKLLADIQTKAIAVLAKVEALKETER